MIPKNNINYNKAQLFLLCGLLLTGGLPFRGEVFSYDGQYYHSLDDSKLRGGTASFLDNPIRPTPKEEEEEGKKKKPPLVLTRNANLSSEPMYSIESYGPEITFYRSLESQDATYLPMQPAKTYFKETIGCFDDIKDDSVLSLMRNRNNYDGQDLGKLTKFFNSGLANWWKKGNSQLTPFANNSVLPFSVASFNLKCESESKSNDYVIRYHYSQNDRYLVNQLSIDFYNALERREQKTSSMSVDKVAEHITRDMRRAIEGMNKADRKTALKGEITRLTATRLVEDKIDSLAEFMGEYIDSLRASADTLYTAEDKSNSYTLPDKLLDNDILHKHETLRKFAIIKDMFTLERMKTWLTTGDDKKVEFDNNGGIKKLDLSMNNPFGVNLTEEDWTIIAESALAYSCPEKLCIKSRKLSLLGKNSSVTFGELKKALSELYQKITSGSKVNIKEALKESCFEDDDAIGNLMLNPGYLETLELSATADMFGYPNVGNPSFTHKGFTHFLTNAIGILSCGESAYGFLESHINSYDNSTIAEKRQWSYIASLMFVKKINEGGKVNLKELIYQIRDMSVDQQSPLSALESEVKKILENHNKDITLTPNDYVNIDKVRDAVKELLKDDKLVSGLMAGYAFNSNPVVLDNGAQKTFDEAFRLIEAALQAKRAEHSNAKEFKNNLAQIFKVQQLKLDTIDDVRKAIKTIEAYFTKADIQILEKEGNFDKLKGIFITAYDAFKKMAKYTSDGKKIIEAFDKNPNDEHKTLKENLQEACSSIELLINTLKKDGFGFSIQDPSNVINGNEKLEDSSKIKGKKVSAIVQGFEDALKAIKQKYGANDNDVDELIKKIGKNENQDASKDGNKEEGEAPKFSSEETKRLNDLKKNSSSNDNLMRAIDKVFQTGKATLAEASVISSKHKFLPATFVNAAQSEEGIKKLGYLDKFWALVSMFKAGRELDSVKPYFELLKSSSGVIAGNILSSSAWIFSFAPFSGLDKDENIHVDCLPKLPAKPAAEK